MATIDIKRLSQLVKNKRGNRNLRDVADEIEAAVGKVSISTLSRIEQEKIPDLSTFMKICEWLEISPSEFSLKKEQPQKSHKEEIFAHLKKDETLPFEVSDTLAKMIEMAYKNSELSKKNDNN